MLILAVPMHQSQAFTYYIHQQVVPQLYEGKSNSTGSDHLGKLRNPGEIAVNIFIADFQVSTEANDSYN
jgi:hypothetical protein